MMTAIIRRFGHESDVTIWFCHMCEKYPVGKITDGMIEQAFEITMKAWEV